MTRLDQFVQLVQTAAIVKSLSLDQLSEGANPSSLAASAVDVARQVKESDLPPSILEACDNLIDYMYHSTIPKPIWLRGIM